MIPERLQLNNFMSYGEGVPALNFSGIDLACLSGANGVGKSAVLEAMTWGLWGKSRAKSDDELVKKGAQDMWVDFEFKLEDNFYRIIRKRSLKGRGQGSLDFMVAQGKDGGLWQSIAGTSKAETQGKINETLKMEYDTFINSAFLRQGHADEFTIKKPTERKNILGRILNLNYFDDVVFEVKDIIRNKGVENVSLVTEVSNLEKELEGKREIKLEKQNIEKELGVVSKKSAIQGRKVNKLQKDIFGLEAKQEKIEGLVKENISLEEEIAELSNRKKEVDKDAARLEKIIGNKKEIEEKYKKYQWVKKEKEDFDKAKDRVRLLQEKKQALLAKMEDEKEKILDRRGKLRAEISESAKYIEDNQGMKEKLAQVRENLRKLETYDQAKEKLAKEIEKEREQYKKIRDGKVRVESEIADFSNRIKKLAKATAACPLCKQGLHDDQRHNVIKEYQNLIQVKDKNLREEAIKLKRAEEKGTKLAQKMGRVEKALSSKGKLEERRENYQKICDEIDRRRKESSKLKTELEGIQGIIKDKKYDLRFSEDMTKLERLIKEVKYNQDKHGQIAVLLNKLEQEGSQENYLALQSVGESLKQVTNLRTKIEGDVSKAKKKLAENKKFIAEQEKSLKGLEDIKKEYNQEKERYDRLRADEAGISQKYGAVSEQWKRLTKNETLLKEKKAKLNSIAGDVSLYQELAVAFGKNGIQAMIIESALPEIEEEANRLLGRLTDGGMTVRLATQRAKKTDGMLKETLDIIIRDIEGEKSYEMFSGGEAFRINFAIRVALSKLLARRAGAKLKLLVIDEGFGTQDASGREHLVEAINTISDDFEKILVVTHIQELKDQFPIKIEVTKDKEGSHIEIVS